MPTSHYSLVPGTDSFKNIKLLCGIKFGRDGDGGLRVRRLLQFENLARKFEIWSVYDVIEWNGRHPNDVIVRFVVQNLQK
jgi:hypothetical protein